MKENNIENQNNTSIDDNKNTKFETLYEKIGYIIAFILSVLILVLLYYCYQMEKQSKYRFGSLQVPFNITIASNKTINIIENNIGS